MEWKQRRHLNPLPARLCTETILLLWLQLSFSLRSDLKGRYDLPQIVTAGPLSKLMSAVLRRNRDVKWGLSDLIEIWAFSTNCQQRKTETWKVHCCANSVRLAQPSKKKTIKTASAVCLQPVTKKFTVAYCSHQLHFAFYQHINRVTDIFLCTFSLRPKPGARPDPRVAAASKT